MTTGLDFVVEALLETFKRLTASVPGAEVTSSGGVHAFVSGIPSATFNVVWLDQLVDQTSLSTILDKLDTRKLPYCVEYQQKRENVTAELKNHGMTREPDLPLMVLERLDALPMARPHRAFRIRRLQPEEAFLHATVAASGFEVKESLFQQLVSADTLRLKGVTCYVGENGGKVVSTALAVAVGVRVGLLNVTTLAQHRGRGYAGAVTLQALADAHGAGAKSAWLQSSYMAYRMYQGIGFRTVADLGFWMRA